MRFLAVVGATWAGSLLYLGVGWVADLATRAIGALL